MKHWYEDIETCDAEGPCEPYPTGYIYDEDGKLICRMDDSDSTRHVVAVPKMLELLNLALMTLDAEAMIDTPAQTAIRTFLDEMENEDLS